MAPRVAKRTGEALTAKLVYGQVVPPATGWLRLVNYLNASDSSFSVNRVLLATSPFTLLISSEMYRKPVAILLTHLGGSVEGYFLKLENVNTAASPPEDTLFA